MGQLYEFDAIGTHWWLERLDGGEFDDATRKALADYTLLFDQRYSRFRGDSLVTQLSAKGCLENPPQEMLVMLDYAQELSNASDGAFSLLVGNQLQRLGYGKTLVKRKREKSDFLRTQVLEWDETYIRAPQGTVLDFGGLGKGWLIDEYANILREHDVKHYIVNGGGDLYVDAAEPILFVLEHPYKPTFKIGDIKIKKGALAASSIVKRVWKKGRKTLHHIIDPTTGKPTDTGIVATFVCAHNALVADALATVLIVRPDLEEALEQHYNAETLLIQASNLKS